MGSFIFVAVLLLFLIGIVATVSVLKFNVRDEAIEIARRTDVKYDQAVSSIRKKLFIKAYGIGAAAYVVLNLLIVFFMSLSSVPASNIGVVTLFGEVQQEVLTEGLHVVNPLANVHYVPIGLDTAEAKKVEAASRDMQTVHTTLTVNYNVDSKGARSLYIMNPVLTYETQYVVPAIYEVFKSVTSMYTAEELITKRTEVSNTIREQLSRKLTAYHLVVQDINITDFAFSKSFNDAIEAKVRATQEAEKAQRDLARIKFEAEQKIVTAKAQAETIRIQSEAIRAQGGKEFVALEGIKKWDGVMPKFIGGNAPVPFISVDNK